MFFYSILKKMSMTKKIIKKSFRITDGILPFTEIPCINYFQQKDENNRDELKAIELFSYFTADIIKEQVIFTR